MEDDKFSAADLIRLAALKLAVKACPGYVSGAVVDCAQVFEAYLKGDEAPESKSSTYVFKGTDG